MIAPHLRRALCILNQKKSVVYCKEDNVYKVIWIRRTNLDTDGLADQWAELIAKGFVLAVCTGVVAGYDKIDTAREEAFRRSEETYYETVKQYSLGMERVELKRTELSEDDENRKKEEETEGENGLKEEETSLVAMESHDRDLAILRAMFDFKISHGHLPYQHSDQLHNHIMKLIPNLDIRGNDLRLRIIALEYDFSIARILYGDDPEMTAVERDIFDQCMQLWGQKK
ncbi:hypothetical protein H5410_038963 [Solanum commersonii]|uniref:Uncharacterized protein n=1 Tax=Solanum commersonii TaxID=4109 RepID=A0A9J5YAI7_SOLCO|nr:hypothetical protein H5410_038963 [Solanum commersonii]